MVKIYKDVINGTTRAFSRLCRLFTMSALNCFGLHPLRCHLCLLRREEVKTN